MSASISIHEGGQSELFRAALYDDECRKDKGYASLYMGKTSLCVHDLTAEQAEAISAQFHNAAIMMGLKVADDPQDDVYELTTVRPHAAANPIP